MKKLLLIFLALPLISFGQVPGCTDSLACNYDVLATIDDGSCSYLTSVVINSQDWGSEMSWNITDSTGTILLSGGPGYADLTDSVDVQSICMNIGCYTMNMYDSYGDGWNGGSFAIYNFNGTLVAQGGLLNGSSGSQNFCIICPSCIYGCTDSTATNYDSTANTDNGNCCYGTTATLQIYTNDQCGFYAQYMAWELQDVNSTVVASGGYNASEQWQDYTYYDYCLPINVSCDVYNLVLYDNYYLLGWNYCSQATALIMSANGDTLFNINNFSNGMSQSYLISMNTTSSNTIVACDSYLWNGVTYTAYTIVTNVFTNANGCDSTATLELTINTTPSATISQIGIDLEATESDTYNWNTSETTQTITPTVNGWYWCVVSDINGCIADTVFYEVINIINAISETTNTKSKLVKIIDMLGQETHYRKNIPLFYLYDDRIVEKRIIIE